MAYAQAPSPDTSPAAIAARRRKRSYDLQDRARILRRDGVKPAAAAAELEVDSRLYHGLAGVSARRAEIRNALATPPGTMPDLKASEALLLRSLLSEQMDLFAASAVRSPETKAVAWHARRSHGWVASTARRRLDAPRRADGSPSAEPSFGLVEIAGNGYVNLTDEGWRVCAALWPDRILL